MPGQLDEVLLQGEVFRGPAPRLAELLPEMLTRGHDPVIVLDQVVDGERADPEAVGLQQLRDLNVRRQKPHDGLLVLTAKRSAWRPSG